MKTLGIIVNIFLPGIGTLIVKKWIQGIIQLIIVFIASLLTFTGIGSIFGIPLLIAVWIWALICTITYVENT